MPLTQSSVLNQGGYNTLFGNTPSGNVTTQNSPGVIPQVYPGSTGSGTQQNSTTPQYGGFTPQAFSPYTPNWSSNQQNNGGLGGTASAFDAWRRAMGGAPMGNYPQPGSQTQTSNPLGVQTANAQTNNGLYGSYGSSGGGSAPALPSYAGNEITGTPTGSFITIGGKNYEYTPGSQPLNGFDNSPGTPIYIPGSKQDPNIGINGSPTPTNTGNNPTPGVLSGSPFSGMQGLYAQMLADYQNRVKQYDDSNLDVNKTTQDLADFQKNYANTIAGVEGNNDWSIDTQQGKAQVLGNQAANTLPYLQTKLNNATALRSQNLNAMSDLASKVKPMPYDVYMDPVTGEVINQGGAGNALFQKGINSSIQNQGGTFQGNKVAIDAVEGPQGMLSSFDSNLKSTGLNPYDTTILNALSDAYNNPTKTQYPILQNAFNNIVAQYAKILGSQKVNSLLQSAKGVTIDSFFNSLSNQAHAVQSGLSGGTSGNTNGTNANDPAGIL